MLAMLAVLAMLQAMPAPLFQIGVEVVVVVLASLLFSLLSSLLSDFQGSVPSTLITSRASASASAAAAARMPGMHQKNSVCIYIYIYVYIYVKAHRKVISEKPEPRMDIARVGGRSPLIIYNIIQYSML